MSREKIEQIVMQINDKLTDTQRDHFVSMIMEEEQNEETREDR